MEDIGSNYGQFFKTLMQDKVLKFGKPTLILAHTQDFMDDKTLETKTYAPIKGALKAQGIESYVNAPYYRNIVSGLL